MGKLIDITGKKFGRLTVIKRVGSNKQGQSTWLCKCDCGNEKVVVGAALRRGYVKSCGCLVMEKTYNYKYIVENNAKQKNDLTNLQNEILNLDSRANIFKQNLLTKIQTLSEYLRSKAKSYETLGKTSKINIRDYVEICSILGFIQNVSDEILKLDNTRFSLISTLLELINEPISEYIYKNLVEKLKW